MNDETTMTADGMEDWVVGKDGSNGQGRSLAMARGRLDRYAKRCLECTRMSPWLRR